MAKCLSSGFLVYVLLGFISDNIYYVKVIISLYIITDKRSFQLFLKLNLLEILKKFSPIVLIS